MFKRIAAAAVLVILAALACAGGVAAAPDPPAAAVAFPPVTAPDPVVEGMIAKVEAATVEQYTGGLSGEWPVMIRGEPYTIATRHTLSATSVRKATYYVGDHLAELGLTVEEQVWDVSRPPNVIGEKTGETRPGDIYMITAHLDDMPEGGAAPGADDNASGSVAVLVAADILSQYRWYCTLRFALWTGEEQGMLGSQAYANRAHDLHENILGVINLDMIAWNRQDTPRSIELHTTPTLPATVDLAYQFAAVIDTYDIPLVPEVIRNGMPYSDHRSFWNAGYVAILGIEDSADFNSNYHKISDSLATLKTEDPTLSYYTDYVRASVAALAHMSDCVVKTPVAPKVTAAVTSGTLALTWHPVVPNTSYRVHRWTTPYFTPDASSLLATLDIPFADPLTYDDEHSGVSDAAINDYYVVQGANEAGATAESNRVGEFDFALMPGTQ